MDTEAEIIKQVESYISLSIAGLEIENSKVDFKSIWYNLLEPHGVNEFIKDASAIANSFGPDGMLIIGYNDKEKVLNNVSFSDCGLRDSSQLPDLINKRVDRLFRFNLIERNIMGHNISIIHIPPSIDKPHVIRNYQTFQKGSSVIKNNEEHKIFIRRGSSTYPASKSDIELMYYDRKNISVDYDILSSLPLSSMRFDFKNPAPTAFYLEGSMNVIMENIGRRPISIAEVMIELSVFDDYSPNEILKIQSSSSYITNPLIIQSGQLINAHIKCTSETHIYASSIKMLFDQLNNERRHFKVINYSLKLSNDETISSPIKLINI